MEVENLKKKYVGKVAQDYEAERKNTVQWRREQVVVEEYLRKIALLNPNPSVLDIPVGTGRFFPVYNSLSLEVMGVDASEDMIECARIKLEKNFSKSNIQLKKGDIMDSSTYGITPDVVICMRFLNWLDKERVAKTLSNLLGSGAQHVIASVRVYDSYYLYKLMRLGKSIVVGSYRSLKNKRLTSSNEESITVHHEDFLIKEIRNNGFYIRDKKLIDTDQSTLQSNVKSRETMQNVQNNYIHIPYFELGSSYLIYWLSKTKG